MCGSGSVPQCHGFATLFLGSKLVQVPIQVEDSENFLQDLLGRSVRHDVEHNLKYKTRETQDCVFKNRLFLRNKFTRNYQQIFLKEKL
jgi:hypothetical protein